MAGRQSKAKTRSSPRKTLTLRRETIKDLGTGTRGRAIKGGLSKVFRSKAPASSVASGGSIL